MVDRLLPLGAGCPGGRPEERQWQIIEPADTSVSAFQEVILRFAKRALGNDPAQELIEASLAIAQRSMDQGDPFLTAPKAGLKTLLCSPPSS